MVKLSIVIPCFNEEKTLSECVEKVLEIANENLELELIIVDDGSSDKSVEIAKGLAEKHFQIKSFQHSVNQGKGATLRTGFQFATGDFVCIQDADLEYDPQELVKLIEPLVQKKADVVLGSRFLSAGSHRVLYFWHSMGNRFLTFLSNMFTDLNLTDMETCYKVFRREIIQSVTIEENRFGFEPEIVAKVAQMRVRIYEMGISYSGRTYEEGKKIGMRDGFRALYCIIRYNAHKAPLPLQFLIYLFIGGAAAVVNVGVFVSLFQYGMPTIVAAPIAFFTAALLNYFLCILLLFRHTVKWGKMTEILIYFAVTVSVCAIDTVITIVLISLVYFSPILAKAIACVIALVFNFLGRKYFVFPEKSSGPWKPQKSA